jgi:hypothetical protein
MFSLGHSDLVEPYPESLFLSLQFALMDGQIGVQFEHEYHE